MNGSQNKISKLVAARRGARSSRSSAPIPLLVQDKRLAAGATLVAVGAVLWPIVENWRDEPKDSFPLSYYPMFSAKRRKRVSMTYLVGVTAEGERRRIPYIYAGGGGLNQVRRQINRLVRAGQGEKVCGKVARKIAREPDGPFADIATVELVSGRYRWEEYFRGQKAPLRERVRASYPVSRAPR